MIVPQTLRFPSKIADRSIFVYLAIQMSLIFLFPANFIGFQWLSFGLFAVVFFFHNAVKLPAKWAKLPEKVFLKEAFRFALLIRLVYVFFSYFYYTWMTGVPFEFGAADSRGYHEEALWVLREIDIGRFGHYLFQYIPLKGLSDSGWSLFLIPIYVIFRDAVLIPRIVNALLSAWMVLLVYRLAKRNFGEGVARLSAILTALLPTLIYYTGLHLKETLMVFLTIAFLNEADKLIRRKTELWKSILSVSIIGGSLFLFRTVLGLSAFFALGIAVVFTSRMIINPGRKLNILIIVAFFGLLVGVRYFGDDIIRYAEESDSNQESQMENYATRKGGNKLATLGNAFIFMPLMPIAPFPTMVNAEQLNAQMINGAVFIKNAIAFFLFLAFFIFWRKKQIRFHLLLIFFFAAYLGILGLSGFAFSERFHMPVLPVSIIFVAVGINNYKSSSVQNYYHLYLLLVFAIVIGWNWFKLAGRGMV